MPQNWKTYKLGDAAEFLPGFAFKGTHMKKGECRAIKIKDVKTGVIDLESLSPLDIAHYDTEKISKFLLNPGDRLVTMTGNLGRLAKVPDSSRPLYVNQRVAKIIPRNGWSADFVYQIVGSQTFRDYCERNPDSSTAQPNISTGTMLNWEITAPPLPEQKAIASILSALDDKIENNLAMNRTLEDMAMALYKHWFVDFGPFQDGNFIDSELGPIPEGWEVSFLGNHIKLDRGLSYKGKHLVDTGIPMVNLKCVLPHGGFRRDGIKFYDGDYKPRHVVVPGDIIIANTDLTQARDIIGSPAFVPNYPNETIIISHHTYALRFLPKREIGKHFTYYSLLNPSIRNRCRGFATGTTVLAIKQEAIEGAAIALPPNNTREAFDEIVSTWHNKIDLNNIENDDLVKLRDTLLPKLISGEVRLKEFEKTIEAAL